MATAYRLVKTKFAATAFSGEGARLYGGRWNSPGVSVVYLAGSVSLAMLEVLVHTEDAALLGSYSIGVVTYDDALASTLERKDLPASWTDIPASHETQAIGDDWVTARTTVILRVPSVVAPGEFNLLVNPAHPELAKLTIGPLAPFRFDSRLFGSPTTPASRRKRSVPMKES